MRYRWHFFIFTVTLGTGISVLLKHQLGLGVLLMIEGLPSMNEALALIPIMQASGKKKKERK